jgi:hypothetical protein
LIFKIGGSKLQKFENMGTKTVFKPRLFLNCLILEKIRGKKTKKYLPLIYLFCINNLIFKGRGSS